MYARRNLLLLDVYLRDPYVKLYVRREKITVISFVGTIGGLLGLFLGFSFISVVEVVYVAAFGMPNRNSNNSSNNNDDQGNSSNNNVRQVHNNVPYLSKSKEVAWNSSNRSDAKSSPAHTSGGTEYQSNYY